LKVPHDPSIQRRQLYAVHHDRGPRHPPHTRRKPCPVGEYQFQILELKPEGGEKDGKPWAKLTVNCETTDPRACEALGMPSVRVRHGIFLDLNDDGSVDLSPGKNIGLGKLREATGLNTPGQPFSPNMMVGRMIVGIVGHRPDKNDATVLYDEITRVRAA
jgi:hypothetical protein